MQFFVQFALAFLNAPCVMPEYFCVIADHVLGLVLTSLCFKVRMVIWISGALFKFQDTKMDYLDTDVNYCVDQNYVNGFSYIEKIFS